MDEESAGSALAEIDRVSQIKGLRAGQRVTFKAQALRLWEVAGARMALVGDESALTRIELRDQDCAAGRSYEFRDLVVKEYPGGWHSASVAEGSEVAAIAEGVTVSQDEAYIERTFKILTGVQRKKARKEGSLSPWKHPGKEKGGGNE